MSAQKDNEAPRRPGRPRGQKSGQRNVAQRQGGKNDGKTAKIGEQEPDFESF